MDIGLYFSNVARISCRWHYCWNKFYVFKFVHGTLNSQPIWVRIINPSGICFRFFLWVINCYISTSISTPLFNLQENRSISNSVLNMNNEHAFSSSCSSFEILIKNLQFKLIQIGVNCKSNIKNDFNFRWDNITCNTPFQNSQIDRSHFSVRVSESVQFPCLRIS